MFTGLEVIWASTRPEYGRVGPANGGAVGEEESVNLYHLYSLGSVVAYAPLGARARRVSRRNRFWRETNVLAKIFLPRRLLPPLHLSAVSGEGNLVRPGVGTRVDLAYSIPKMQRNGKRRWRRLGQRRV